MLSGDRARSSLGLAVSADPRRHLSSPNVRFEVTFLPFLSTVMVYVSQAYRSPFILSRSWTVLTVLPAIATRMSPLLMPAFSAALPRSLLSCYIPWGIP